MRKAKSLTKAGSKNALKHRQCSPNSREENLGEYFVNAFSTHGIKPIRT